MQISRHQYEEVIMDFPGKPNVIRRVLKLEEGGRREEQRDGCRRKMKLPLLAFEMKE